MKNKFFQLSLASLTVMVIAVGCLKDKYYDDHLTGLEINRSQKIIELSGPPSSSLLLPHSLTINLPFSTVDTTFNLVVVRLASDQPADKDIQVVLDTTSSYLKLYNDSLGTHYVVPPSSQFKFENLTVTIPKGKREGYLRVTMKSSNLVNKEYAFPFFIKSVSDPSYTVSGNYDYQIVIVGVKNKYDALYKLRQRIESARPTILNSTTYDWPGIEHIGMITTGTNSNKLFDYYAWHDYILPILSSTGGLSGFGQTAPKFTFDLTTNALISVTNDFPNPTNGRTFRLNPDITTSRFDPTTRTIYAAYIMDQPANAPTYIYDTLTFAKER